MGLRYRRSIRLGKYLKLNIGKSSVGLSAGVRGAHVSVNSNGRKTTSVGIPGTGISYVKASTIGKSGHKASGNPYPVQPQNNFSPTETTALPPPPDGMIRVGKKDYKPEALKKLSTVILVLSVLIIITSFCIMPIGILFLVFGLILFYFGNTYRKVVKAYRSNQALPILAPHSDPNAANLSVENVPQADQLTPIPIESPKIASESFENSEFCFEFPETDENGMRLLKVLDNIHLTGVTKMVDGENPQDVLCDIIGGERVILEHRPMKQYPDAVLALTAKRLPLGWIPEGSLYQADIAKRLDDGTTVYAYVSEIIGGEDGKKYGCLIDIGRYEKQRVNKKKSSSENA